MCSAYRLVRALTGSLVGLASVVGFVGCATAAPDSPVGLDSVVELPSYTTVYDVEMLPVRAGTFEMGSTDLRARASEIPVVAVTLTHNFWLGKREVTQQQWFDVTGERPSRRGDCTSCPVDSVTWQQGARMLNRMSEAESLDACYTEDGTEWLANPYECAGYRFPTEAEWEYSARAGESYRYAGSDDVDEVAWWVGNSGGGTHPSCAIDPDGNGWGFCDMSGNVNEYANDWVELQVGYDNLGGVDPVGPETGSVKVDRGGTWGGEEREQRVSARSDCPPTSNECLESGGLRVARTIP